MHILLKWLDTFGIVIFNVIDRSNLYFWKLLNLIINFELFIIGSFKVFNALRLELLQN